MSRAVAHAGIYDIAVVTAIPISNMAIIPVIALALLRTNRAVFASLRRLLMVEPILSVHMKLALNRPVAKESSTQAIVAAIQTASLTIAGLGWKSRRIRFSLTVRMTRSSANVQPGVFVILPTRIDFEL